MFKLLTTDWAEYLFDFFSLKLYEYKQEKNRRSKRAEKKQIIKYNRIIVKVNGSTIYDSKKEKDMSDELYYALLSYGLKETLDSQDRNRKSPINYNIVSSISSMPVIDEQGIF